MATKPQQARVLVAAHGLAAGQLVEGTPAQIAALVADGAADDSAAAVAYAKAEHAPVHKLEAAAGAGA